MKKLISYKIHSVTGGKVDFELKFDDKSKYRKEVDGFDVGSEESVKMAVLDYSKAYLSGLEIENQKNSDHSHLDKLVGKEIEV